MTQLFFQTVQNKMHWAAHGHTAAEIVRQRADAARPNMGLTTWKNAPAGPVRRQDVTIAKNYRQWPRVPRTVQVLSGAGGRAFLHGLSVRRAERVTSESCPWCGTLALGQSASLETTVRRRKSRCWRLGPCRVGRAGSSTSTDRKPRRSWRRCVVACNAAVRSARELGATRSSADWDWKARFAPKAAPRNAKTVPDTSVFSSPPFLPGGARDLAPDVRCGCCQ